MHQVQSGLGEDAGDEQACVEDVAEAPSQVLGSRRLYTVTLL